MHIQFILIAFAIHLQGMQVLQQREVHNIYLYTQKHTPAHKPRASIGKGTHSTLVKFIFLWLYKKKYITEQNGKSKKNEYEVCLPTFHERAAGSQTFTHTHKKQCFHCKVIDSNKIVV